MENFRERVLGSTGLRVGRLGLAASYGAPAKAFEEAFEKGCNYFYLGSGRHRAGMKQAIRNLSRKGRRDQLVVAIHTYARSGLLTEYLLRKNLRSLGLDQADRASSPIRHPLGPDAESEKDASWRTGAE